MWLLFSFLNLTQHKVAKLKSLGVYEDTFILFTGDNGPSTEPRNWINGIETSYTGVSAGPLKGCKYSLFDGGIREPAIISYPRFLEQKVRRKRIDTYEIIGLRIPGHRRDRNHSGCVSHLCKACRRRNRNGQRD